MDLAHPLSAISPSMDLALLVALSASRDSQSGRQLAKAIGRSPTGVQHVLDRLVREGLVERRTAGRAFLYSFNHDHLLAPVVQQMSGIRLELIDRLRELFEHWDSPPVHASLFGSAARGDGDADSDIDVFLVRPKEIEEDQPEWRGMVGHLEESIERLTGNTAGIVELPESDLGKLRRRRPAILGDLTDDGIDLAGKPLRKVLAGR